MPYFKLTNGYDVFLNSEPRDCLDDGSALVHPRAMQILSSLRKLSHVKPLTDKHKIAIDELLYEHYVCVSAVSLFQPALHRDVCREFNDTSVLARHLRLALANAGSFHFLEKLSPLARPSAEGTVERFLAIFSACTAGIESLEDAPIEFIHAVVDIFRSSDGLGWNEAVLGKNRLTVQCMSNIIAGLASIFNDPTLASKARKHRPSSGARSQSWLEFQHSKHGLDREIREIYKRISEDSLMRVDVARSAVLNIAAWLKKEFPTLSLKEIVSSPVRENTFANFMTVRNGGEIKEHTLTILDAARRISSEICEQLSAGSEEKVYDLISKKEVKIAKGRLPKKTRPARVRSRPLPEKLIPILREILEEGEEGWPGRNFRVDVSIDGAPASIYCPVIPSLFRAMLLIPLRMGQLRRLDSGEGDVVNFNGDTLSWELNTGPLAGYWADLAGQPREGFPTKGYAIEIQDEIKPVTGIWVNTNKTGEPFAMPWHQPAFLKILWDLRRWQETYNPISAPIKPDLYLDAPQRYPAATRAALPSIFSLTRLPPNAQWPMEGRTVTASQMDHAWCKCLLEIEQRWNARHGGNPITLVDIHAKNGQPFRPRYNMHGLRVRGLTELRRGGMPTDLLSKFIAGHATLAMTIAYTEPEPFEIAQMVERAGERAVSQRQFIDELKRMDLKEAQSRTVSLSPTAVADAIQLGSQFQFCNVAIGVCPYDGSRCSDGGALLRKAEVNGVSQSTYGPVEPRNCVVCRHFISGPPWLNELLAYGTKLCERRTFLAGEQERTNAAAGELERAFHEGRIVSAEFENRWDELGADIQKIQNAQEAVETAIFNVELYCHASVKLLDRNPNTDKLMLVANSRSSIVSYEEISEFSQALRICAAGSLHTILGEERVERNLRDYLDAMCFNSGFNLRHMLINASPAHKRAAYNQMGLLINTRASQDEIDDLLSGNTTLKQLGLEEKIRKLVEVELSAPQYVGRRQPFIAGAV